MASLRDRFRNAWNVFRNNRDPTGTRESYSYWGNTTSYRPDRIRINRGAERTIINSIITRIAIDVAAVSIQHVRVDENGRYLSRIPSTLNECLLCSANLDQSGRELIQDIVESMCMEGCVAVVPTDIDDNPEDTTAYNILQLRVARIVQWMPKSVRVECYDENDGQKKQIEIEKERVMIVTNPLYSVMNEPNSTLKRLLRKLNLLDYVDEQSSTGKLDLIIQLPYLVKTDKRRKEAERRRQDIQDQLEGSKYGIAYTDGTEKIQQLNRPIENNMLDTIQYLTDMLYGELGITKEVMDGTADEQTMLNYYNRSIEPILSAITNEMKRKFLTKTARTQGQSIMFFRDPFRLATMNNIADIVMKLTSSEAISSNEARSFIGLKPVNDERADELRNKNLYNTDPFNPINTENTVDNENALPAGQYPQEELYPQDAYYDQYGNTY